MNNNIEWECPKCGSHAYTSIDIWTGPTDDPEILNLAIRPVIKTLYMCNKCSLIFGDPDKFSLITDLDYDKQSIETSITNTNRMMKPIEKSSKILLNIGKDGQENDKKENGK